MLRNKFKEVKDLYAGTMTLMRKIEEDTDKWERYPMFMDWKN